MSVLLYGGGFNPPHPGHVAALKSAVEALRPERVLVIPDGRPPHKLLPEQAHIGRRVELFDVAIRRREHAAGSARLITYRNDFALIENIITTFCGENGDQELDDVAAGVKLTSVHVLIKPADQVLKDIAHLNTVESFDGKVKFGECFNDRIKAAVLIHLFDVLFHIQLTHDLAHVCREAVQVLIKVCCDVIRVVAKLFQRVL